MSEVPEGVQIDDPEDYSTSQRLKQIYEARRELREMRREAATHRHKHPRRALAYYRTGVESYLMEVDTLFQQNDEGRRLWSERLFGTVTIEPPEPPETSYYKINSYEKPDPISYKIRGLVSLFELDSEITHVFEMSKQHELRGVETKRVERSAPVPWNTLNRMVTDTNSYLAYLGIGLEIDETDEWEI